METYRNFYAKILLFGEYSVICNSMGLTIPYQAYSGIFRQAETLTEEQQHSRESLKGFYKYLLQLSGKNELLTSLDFKKFKNTLDNGLYFDSQIPQSYGIGSSGALSAAVFDHFGLTKMETSLPELKRIFAQMESWFHGISSGLDPLISYLNKPLLIHDKEKLETVPMPKGLLSGELTTFLVDTGQTGKTNNLVQLFFDECRHYKFYKEVKDKLIPLNNRCIHLFSEGDIPGFISEIKMLSTFFWEYFKPMIPSEFHGLWEKGINEDLFTLKLCGSGGGGFLLGFTSDFETVQKEFKGINLHKIGQSL